MQYPVLETNKEVVMMLIVLPSKPDDVNALKSSLEKKENQIELLVAAKDNLEGMIIELQKQMLENQDNVMDKIILKAALDFDDRDAAKKNLNPKK